MSAINAAGAAPRSAAVPPIIRVLRLHLVSPMVFLGVPWVITAVAFAISLVIALLIRAAVTGADLADALEGMQYSWAVISPLWYLVVVGVQAVASTFPFTLGFSVTRREFALGTLLTYVAVSAVNAAGWTVLTEIEKATGGFGIGLRHFTSMWFGGLDAFGVWLSWVAVQLLLFAVGSAFAAVYVRWRVKGMLILWIGVAVVLLAAVAGIVLTGSGPAVIAWFTGFTLPGLFAAAFVPVVVAFLLGWLVLRRATPRS